MSAKIPIIIGSNNIIEINLSLDQLYQFPVKIKEQIWVDRKLYVHSNVEPQIFQCFIDYFLQSKKNSDEELSNVDTFQYYLLIKELGINNDLLSDQQPVLSHFIRMSVEGIYRIRRETRAVKQSAIQNNDQQSLSDYLLNLKKKCIFLINGCSNKFSKKPKIFLLIFFNAIILN